MEKLGFQSVGLGMNPISKNELNRTAFKVPEMIGSNVIGGKILQIEKSSNWLESLFEHDTKQRESEKSWSQNFLSTFGQECFKKPKPRDTSGQDTLGEEHYRLAKIALDEFNKKKIKTASFWDTRAPFNQTRKKFVGKTMLSRLKTFKEEQMNNFHKYLKKITRSTNHKINDTGTVVDPKNCSSQLISLAPKINIETFIPCGFLSNVAHSIFYPRDPTLIKQSNPDLEVTQPTLFREKSILFTETLDENRKESLKRYFEKLSKNIKYPQTIMDLN
ncbi:hypothetical protein RF11_14759 [Thelohanellus kitauei]|uniref:Uncharacterized protein n=1 Tax=Thelohanellus kitauei TaxID=669202 RepID=A0A0C2MX95_THEKT|nr:hypothetical protein RF11_14759 [Thelohanellus kitauei]